MPTGKLSWSLMQSWYEGYAFNRSVMTWQSSVMLSGDSFV